MPARLNDLNIDAQPGYWRTNHREPFCGWNTTPMPAACTFPTQQVAVSAPSAMLEALEKPALPKHDHRILRRQRLLPHIGASAGKWSHYEGLLRVPLIIHDPRVPKSDADR